MTFKNAQDLQHTARKLPEDRLLVETDSPFLAPVPHRGQTCEPAFVADTAAFLAATVLYLLTVGPVRGFAFFLGLSTLLDLFVAYFFTRPMVAVLANNRTFTEARGLGVARGLAATEASF